MAPKLPGTPKIVDNFLTAENKKYCSPCVYKGCFTEGYLCNFNVLTGRVRGCKAGVGCTQRVLDAPVKKSIEDRSCEICGATYKGTTKSHYCPSCRKEAISKSMKERWQNHFYDPKKAKKRGQI